MLEFTFINSTSDQKIYLSKNNFQKVSFKMKNSLLYAFFVQATAAVSPFAIFNFLSWVFKLIFLARPLIGQGHHLVGIHLKTFTSESNNFESASIRYLPKELLATKITKRHHDLKSIKSHGSAKAKKKHLRRVLMTHYVILIWNTKYFLWFLLVETERSKIHVNHCGVRTDKKKNLRPRQKAVTFHFCSMA